MFDLSKNSTISFNPQYYTIQHKKSQENRNIYLGGSKIQQKSQKSLKKGINLSKSLSCHKKLSNLNHLQAVTKKPLENVYFNVIPSNQSLKPKIHTNHSKSQIYNHYSLKRSQSSPLFLGSPFRTSSISLENSLCKVKIINNLQNNEHSQFYKSQIKPQVTLRKQIYCHQQSIFSPNNQKIQLRNISPGIKIVQQQNLVKNINKSINYQFSNNTLQSSKMINNYIPVKMSVENIQNTIKNPFQASPSINKTIRPITFKSPVKTTINFNTLYQQKNNLLQSKVKNQQNQPTYQISVLKLKQSISTAQERSNQQYQNYCQKSQETIQNPQNQKTQNWAKTQKYSVKSLWDSVEKCTISLICQNNQHQQVQSKNSTFNKKIQRTYNELSNFNCLDQYVIDNYSADNKNSTFLESQYTPIRNL